MPDHLRVDITPSEQVTAILYPAAPRDAVGISLILAHGAGTNQTSGFMVQIAGALAARGIEGGFDLSRHFPELGDALLVCATEVHTSADIASYATALGEVLKR
jgi:glycine cleavage system pyridoxal-binding protein P